ncbi:MAG: outer membrane lipoprotein-sorting protein [Alphaproteobacteria bacterium]
MGRFTMLVAAAAVAVWVSPAGAQDNLTGRQIMDEVSERHDRPFEFEVQKMTLIDRSGNEEKRDVQRYAREISDDETRYLMAFHAPSGIRGTALLTWQQDNQDDDQWLYLPAQGNRAKRIAEGGRKNYFMGTDYTFEDLISESRDKFSYERLPDETIDGTEYFVVDAFPQDATVKAETGYKSRRFFVLKDIFFIARTDYFDRRGRFIKKQAAEQIEQIDGDMYRARISLMDNEKLKHKTRIEVIERTFEEGDVPEQLFHTRFITSNRHLR